MSRVYLDPRDAAEYRELVETRDRSIAALRAVADHRRVAVLVEQINATLADEHLADCVLTLAELLGDWLRTMPAGEQTTAVGVIGRLLIDELADEEGLPP